MMYCKVNKRKKKVYFANRASYGDRCVGIWLMRSVVMSSFIEIANEG